MSFTYAIEDFHHELKVSETDYLKTRCPHGTFLASFAHLKIVYRFYNCTFSLNFIDAAFFVVGHILTCQNFALKCIISFSYAFVKFI